MFNFARHRAKAKAPETAPPPVSPQPDGPSGEPTGEAGIDKFLPAKIVPALLGQLAREGSFIGAFAGVPGFQSGMTPDGIEILRIPHHLAGGIIAENVAAFSFAGLGPVDVGWVSVSSAMKHYLDWEPQWEVAGDNRFTASRPFGGPGFMLYLDVEGKPVDPLFSQDETPGTVFIMRVGRAES